MRLRSILRFTIGLLIVLCAIPAFAEDQEAAVRLAGEANTAFQAGDYVTAAQKFAEAHANYPDHSLKMNEMVSWYKAKRCEESLVVAQAIITSASALGERDKRDLGKVHEECGYDEARSMFEANDLDGAEARLQMVQTDDAGLAIKIGELRGAIKERRKRVVANQNTTPDDTVADPAPEAPIEPPPTWMKPVGLGLAGGGAVGLVAVGVKYALERRNLQRNDEYYVDNYECSFINDVCDSASLGADADAYRSAQDGRSTADLTNVIFGTLSGVGLVSGAGLFIYSSMRQSSYDASQSTVVSIAPMLGPDITGATLLLRF